MVLYIDIDCHTIIGLIKAVSLRKNQNDTTIISYPGTFQNKKIKRKQ